MMYGVANIDNAVAPLIIRASEAENSCKACPLEAITNVNSPAWAIAEPHAIAVLNGMLPRKQITNPMTTVLTESTTPNKIAILMKFW